MLKVTVLSENTGCDGCPGEHGLSLYIEKDGHRILLDAGQSPLFAMNAKTMGIALEDVNIAVLSHAHYDHADGFATFFEENNKAMLYVREEAGECFYSQHEAGLKYIGPKRGLLTENKDRIVYVKEAVYQISDTDLFLVAHDAKGLSAIGEKAKLYQKVNGELLADDFAHEQTLVLETGKGLVICNSCSHAGPANVLAEVKRVKNGIPVYAYIGGFHLSKYSDSDVYAFAETLQGSEIARIITGHCTGERALEILQEKLGDRVEAMHAGMEIIL